jgi:hypothetical protein
VGGYTALTTLLGDHLLISVTEVGSLASALGWLIACVAFLRIAGRARDRVMAAAGALVAFVFVLLKLLPWVPGSFSRGEYIALAAWIATGIVLRLTAMLNRERVTEIAGVVSTTE